MDDIRGLFSRWLDLPEDLPLDLPRLTFVGDLQILLENHRGVLSFHEDEAVVATRIGPLTIWGKGLRVGAVDLDAIVLTGRIEGIRYRRG